MAIFTTVNKAACICIRHKLLVRLLASWLKVKQWLCRENDMCKKTPFYSVKLKLSVECMRMSGDAGRNCTGMCKRIQAGERWRVTTDNNISSSSSRAPCLNIQFETAPFFKRQKYTSPVIRGVGLDQVPHALKCSCLQYAFMISMQHPQKVILEVNV